MISGSSAIGTDWFLNGIASLERRQTKTQQELSSGFQVQDAADSPSQAAELVGLGSALAGMKSYSANLGRVQSEGSAADTALGTGITLLDQARALAVQGASSITTTADRQNLAVQVKSIQQQLVSIANTTVEGRYIFGGDQDQAPPYALDPTSATGVNALTAQTSTRTITDPAGQLVYQGNTAAAIFDPRDSAGAPTAANTFAALQQLYTALQADDTTGIGASLTLLQSSASALNQAQAGYGSAEQRLTREQTSTATQITELQVRISAIRDTDPIKSATDLAQENVSQSAAFGAQAQISRKSLFDFLA